MLNIYNQALNEILSTSAVINITDINNWIYSTAVAFSTKHNLFPTYTRQKKRTPVWKKKMDKSIDQLRKELSIVEEISRGTDVKSRKGRRVKKKYNINGPAPNDEIEAAKEVLKQKLLAKAQRRRRIDLRCKFFRQNKLYHQDTKRFYRELGKTSIEVKAQAKFQ